MIADAIKPSLSMPTVNVCHRHITSFRRSRAMNNNKINISHIYKFLLICKNNQTSETSNGHKSIDQIGREIKRVGTIVHFTQISHGNV